MMNYLTIKNRKNRKRTSKREARTEVYLVKADGYADSLREEIYIPKKRSFIIYGDADSGKTRIINKLYANRKKVYGDCLFLRFDALTALNDWLRGYEGGTVNEKLNSLREEVTSTNKRIILFCDDLNRLQGRKLQVVKEFLILSNIYIATSLSITRVPTSLRKFFTDEKVKTVELKSAASYDMTTALILLTVFLSILAGMPEVAMGAGALAMLAQGRLSSRDN